MVRGHCPCAFFFPVTTVQNFPRCHCPRFYILPFTLARPGPCKCVHSVPLRVHVPPPGAGCSPPGVPARHHQDQAALPLRSQLCRRGRFVQNLSLPSSAGGPDPLSPSSSLPLVRSLAHQKGATVKQPPPQTSPWVGVGIYRNGAHLPNLGLRPAGCAGGGRAWPQRKLGPVAPGTQQWAWVRAAVIWCLEQLRTNGQKEEASCCRPVCH